MQKIVINKSAGFGLSHKAIMRYAELKGIKLTAYVYEYPNNKWERYDTFKHDDAYETSHRLDYFIDVNKEIIAYDEYDNNKYFADFDIMRTDPMLIQTVEELGADANSDFSELKIITIPDDVDWYIDEVESGSEIVRERARWWG